MNKKEIIFLLTLQIFTYLAIVPCFISISNDSSLNENMINLNSVSSISKLQESAWINNGVPIVNLSNGQTFPQICSDGAGGAIIVWHDERDAFNNDRIYVQRINSSGDIYWTTNGVLICALINSVLDQIKIIANGNGGAIITWRDYRDSNYDIYAQKINSTGHTKWFGNGLAICNDTSAQESPNLCSDGAGGAIITWHDYRNFGTTDYDIYAQHIDTNGITQWMNNGTLICNASNYQRYPQLCSDGNGGAIITWYDGRGTNYDIYAQRINSSGNLLWNNNGEVICNATGEQSNPRICKDGINGSIIAWVDARDVDKDIYSQRINSSGIVQWISNGISISKANNTQENQQICSNGVNGSIIVWEDNRTGSRDIYAQKINLTGSTIWEANGSVICDATNHQEQPQICADELGGAFFTWQDQRSSAFDIYAQYIDSDGIAQWRKNGIPVCTASDEQRYPQLCVDGANELIITWHDLRNGTLDYDIYAQGTSAIRKQEKAGLELEGILLILSALKTEDTFIILIIGIVAAIVVVVLIVIIKRQK